MDIAGLPTEPFEYQLNFENLATDDLILRQVDNTFGAGPVREESLLSSWSAPNWLVEGGRVRQIRSRAKEYEIRRGRLQAEFDRSGESGDVKPFVLIQNPPISLLAFGNWQWTDCRVRGTVQGGRDGHSGIAFRYRDGRHYYAVTVERGVGLRIMLRSGDNHHELARIPLDGERRLHSAIRATCPGLVRAARKSRTGGARSRSASSSDVRSRRTASSSCLVRTISARTPPQIMYWTRARCGCRGPTTLSV